MTSTRMMRSDKYERSESMKYLPENQADCANIRQRNRCTSCIHNQFCTKQHEDEFNQPVVPYKKEAIDRAWHGDKGKKGKGGFM